MTTILVDTRTGKMYADSLISSTRWNSNPLTGVKKDHNQYYESSDVKIYQNCKKLVGASGCMNLASKVKQAILEEVPLPPLDEKSLSVTVLAMTKIGGTLRLMKYETAYRSKFFGLIKEYYWKITHLNTECRYYACGSGSNYILGAMYAGASVEDAFKATSLLDKGTGGELQERGFE